MAATNSNIEFNGKGRVFFGIAKASRERMYLSAPSWDCDWYWGLGYLGNKNCHYHLSGYQNGRNINIVDALQEDYDLNPVIEDNIWEFCELMKTAYGLKEAAEVLGRGGSHYTTNPCKDVIVNTDEAKRINEVALPAVLKAVAKLFEEK
jgi:hypothetical protein